MKKENKRTKEITQFCLFFCINYLNVFISYCLQFLTKKIHKLKQLSVHFIYLASSINQIIFKL